MTRCTPCSPVARFRKSLNSSASMILRADTCGTGSSPAARMAATASRVRLSGKPGSDGTYTQVLARNKLATSPARCNSRGDISSEPAEMSSDKRARAPSLAAGGRESSVALAGHGIGFIQDPEAAVLLQDLARGLEVAPLAKHGGEPCIVDLRDIDRRVPRREQRRGADAVGNLGGQRMHVVTEQGPGVRVGVEIVAPRVLAELRL